jgi:putative heme-binding domain-containing protein
MAAGMDARVRLDASSGAASHRVGYSEIVLGDSARVEMFAASAGPFAVYLNGKVIFQRDKPGVIGPYPDRFEASLAKGLNRVLVRLDGGKEPTEFLLRFRQRTANPERERLALAALSRAGNPARGREVFLNAEKSLCIRCHRVGEQGERIGPELTGLGSRFAKVHIVESVLEPSRTISPSFETIAVALRSGKVLNGLKVAEDDNSLTLADNEGKKHVVARKEIEEQRKLPLSTMPDGLEKRLTEDEFVDLVSFLVNLKENRGR